jgi:hypothetical protein
MATGDLLTFRKLQPSFFHLIDIGGAQTDTIGEFILPLLPIYEAIEKQMATSKFCCLRPNSILIRDKFIFESVEHDITRGVWKSGAFLIRKVGEKIVHDGMASAGFINSRSYSADARVSHDSGKKSHALPGSPFLRSAESNLPLTSKNPRSESYVKLVASHWLTEARELSSFKSISGQLQVGALASFRGDYYNLSLTVQKIALRLARPCAQLDLVLTPRCLIFTTEGLYSRLKALVTCESGSKQTA